MALGAKIRRVVEDYKPSVGTAFFNYLDLVATEPEPVELAAGFHAEYVESSSDPMFARVVPRWQRRLAAPRLDSGDWYLMVLLDDDKVFGHFWVALRHTRGWFQGFPRVHLSDRGDEAYGFDLYLEPEYRRGAVGQYVAYLTITSLRDRGVSIGYTHVLHDNVPSIFWHHGVGFNWVQTFNYLNIGPRIWWKIPFSESPRHGPLSRRGRHTERDPQMPFGGSYFPQ
jgi:ribosomal protein S18 acetylase RimI-like enzyme